MRISDTKAFNDRIKKSLWFIHNDFFVASVEVCPLGYAPKKMDLFVLDLSFIGWILLGSITLGIAYIWIVPYMTATRTNAYNAIKPSIEFATVAEETTEE